MRGLKSFSYKMAVVCLLSWLMMWGAVFAEGAKQPAPNGGATQTTTQPQTGKQPAGGSNTVSISGGQQGDVVDFGNQSSTANNVDATKIKTDKMDNIESYAMYAGIAIVCITLLVLVLCIWNWILHRSISRLSAKLNGLEKANNELQKKIRRFSDQTNRKIEGLNTRPPMSSQSANYNQSNGAVASGHITTNMDAQPDDSRVKHDQPVIQKPVARPAEPNIDPAVLRLQKFVESYNQAIDNPPSNKRHFLHERAELMKKLGLVGIACINQKQVTEGRDRPVFSKVDSEAELYGFNVGGSMYAVVPILWYKLDSAQINVMKEVLGVDSLPSGSYILKSVKNAAVFTIQGNQYVLKKAGRFEFSEG